MSIRSLAILAVLGLSVVAFADPLKFTVRIKGEKVGTYVEETTGSDTDGYVDDSTLTLTHEGKTATIHEIAHYGKDGIDTSKSVDISEDDHEAKVKATLTDDGAKLSIWTDSDKDEKDVPLGSKTPRADPTNFWWKGVTPDAGQTVTYQSFDLETLTWSDVTLKFVGRTKVKLGDKEVDANEVDRTEGEESSKIYVDDKGDALLVEDGDMRIERDM
jgi:hypothetical protein